MKNIILESIVGSILHGVSVEDGLEDLDLMAVCIEPVEDFLGFNTQDVWVQRTKPEGVRSEAGDTDRVVYGLKKYLGLALKGNPTIILLLFVPEKFIRIQTEQGRQLRALRSSLISQQVFSPFRGYLKQQYERLLGTRGQMNVTRPELIEKYGFDTKYAGHVVRLGLQGIELLSTGNLTLPMKDEDRRLVVDVRTGKYSFDEVCDMVPVLDFKLDDALSSSNLPERPDYIKVQNWMIKTYLENYSNVY